MQIFKLALSLAGLLLAGQALAHKAPRLSATSLAPARLVPLQNEANPASLLDGMAGRGAHGTPAALGMMFPEPPAKSTETNNRINRRH